MLKLLIADDERIIRETIFNIIDWKKHDIEVIGLCKNGIEAYDMILDESPDIVLTDIRMPGMGGLELIRKICQTDLQIQFIILSGYGEFEYAKEAMSYGIRHYLLKPCNETQILECIEQCREDHEKQARERKMLQQQFVLYDGMFHSVLSSIINDCLDEKMTLEELISPYEQYLDFHFAAYRLFYVYYLEFQGLPSFLQQLKAYMEEKMPQTILYGMYVKNTLVLFMQNAGKACDDLHVFLQQLSPEGQKITTEIREENYSSLKTLLTQVTGKLLRYSMIYYINHFHITAICNYNWVIDQIRVLYQQIQEGNREKTDQAVELLNSIDNIDFLKQLADKLGGVVAASRAAVDAGWIDHSYQVGQTGTTVKPKVYFACGISGAIQHVAGMQDSELIVAINTNESAPIFEIADVGIVGDLYKVIPAIIEELDKAEAKD